MIQRFFLDTEFNDKVGNCRIEPISIGIVHESGAEYYGVSNEFNAAAPNHPWLHENVIAKLPPVTGWISLRRMRGEIMDYFNQFAPAPGTETEAEIWGRFVGMDAAVTGLIFDGLGNFFEDMNKIGFSRTHWKDSNGLRDRILERRLMLPVTEMPDSKIHVAIHDAQNERLETLAMLKTLAL